MKYHPSAVVPYGSDKIQVRNLYQVSISVSPTLCFGNSRKPNSLKDKIASNNALHWLQME